MRGGLTGVYTTINSASDDNCRKKAGLFFFQKPRQNFLYHRGACRNNFLLAVQNFKETNKWAILSSIVLISPTYVSAPDEPPSGGQGLRSTAAETYVWDIKTILDNIVNLLGF
jgi:hypothetical protein